VFLIVPLGDIRDKKKIILIQIVLASLSLLGLACASNIFLLYLFSFLVGLTTGVPQVIIPFAAQLAQPKERGKIIGTVVSAVLIGILLARTVSGLIGFMFGWRYMFGFAAVLMTLLGILLYFRLPNARVTVSQTYKELLRSLFGIIRKYPVLKRISITGAMLFGAFSVFWTSLTFLLEGAPYNMNANQIGLFGLVGAVGAFGARVVGGLNDRKDSRLLIIACIVLAAIAFVLMGVAGMYLIGIVIGVVILDFGVQGAMVSVQSIVYSLSDSERSRLNTVFIVSNFLGGALGSTLGSMIWNSYNWTGVCVAGTVMLVLALLVNLKPMRR
jgi:predicted MFS family arabinose efflux permease